MLNVAVPRISGGRKVLSGGREAASREVSVESTMSLDGISYAKESKTCGSCGYRAQVSMVEGMEGPGYVGSLKVGSTEQLSNSQHADHGVATLQGQVGQPTIAKYRSFRPKDHIGIEHQ